MRMVFGFSGFSGIIPISILLLPVDLRKYALLSDANGVCFSGIARHVSADMDVVAAGGEISAGVGAHSDVI